MEKKGWIKLYRKIINSGFWLDGTPFDKRSAWIDLLLLAEHEDKGEFKAGQVYKSKQELAKRWGWSVGKVSRFLDGMINETRIETKNRMQNGTVVTIVNWAMYQTGGTQNGTKNGTPDGAIDSNHLKKNKKYKAMEGGHSAPSLANGESGIVPDWDEEKKEWVVRL